MLRYDFTAFHRPEYMLCECNLLSRHNMHADLLRAKEVTAVKERDQKLEGKIGDNRKASKRKATIEVGSAATVSLSFPVVDVDKRKYPTFAAIADGFSSALRSYGNRPGFSHQALRCMGSYVNRSFLAELCDSDRLMGTLTPSGVHLVNVAKQELNMPAPMVFEGAGKQAWIEANNLPGPAKLCRQLIDPNANKDIDWLWSKLRSLKSSDALLYRQLVSAARRNGCRAVILYWNGQDKAMTAKAED